MNEEIESNIRAAERPFSALENEISIREGFIGKMRYQERSNWLSTKIPT